MKTESKTIVAELEPIADVVKFDTTKAEIKRCVTIIADLPKVISPESRTLLYTALTDAAKMEKIVEARRLEITKPLRDRVEALNNYAKSSLLAPLSDIIFTRKREIIAYDTEQEKLKQAEIARLKAEADEKARVIYEAARIEREKLEAEEKTKRDESARVAEEAAKALKGIAKIKALAEAEASRISAEAEAEKAKQEIETRVEIDAAIAKADVIGEIETIQATKGKGMAKRWTFEITDITIVPHIYLQIVPALVNEQIRSGIREIPGIRIFQADGLILK